MAKFNRAKEIKKLMQKMDALSPSQLIELAKEYHRLRGDRLRLAEIEEFRLTQSKV